MKNDLSTLSLKNSLVKFKDFVVRYRFVIFIIIVSLIIGFMFIRIAIMSTAVPNSQQEAEAKNVQVVEIDNESILIIKQLEDKNISIQALFDPGRYDPFSD